MLSLDFDLKYPDWSIIVVVHPLVNLRDLFTFLAVSSFQFKGCVPAKSTSQLAKVLQLIYLLSVEISMPCKPGVLFLLLLFHSALPQKTFFS